MDLDHHRWWQRRENLYDEGKVCSHVVRPDWLESLEKADIEVLHLEAFLTFSESISVDDVFRGSLISEIHMGKSSFGSPCVHSIEEIEHSFLDHRLKATNILHGEVWVQHCPAASVEIMILRRDDGTRRSKDTKDGFVFLAATAWCTGVDLIDEFGVIHVKDVWSYSNNGT